MEATNCYIQRENEICSKEYHLIKKGKVKVKWNKANKGIRQEKENKVQEKKLSKKLSPMILNCWNCFSTNLDLLLVWENGRQSGTWIKILVDMGHRSDLVPALPLICYGAMNNRSFFVKFLVFLLVKWSWYPLCLPYKDMVHMLLLFLQDPISCHLFCELTFMAASLFLLFLH